MSEVKRYRPWFDHGGSPVLEEVGPDGLVPPGAPEIHPDYDIQVVLASDYDALAAELAEAHSHEGAKDAQIAELLAYLHFDESISAYRDWVADCQSLEAENARLRAALRSIVDAYDARSELFTKDADCAANLRDRAALAAGSGE